MPAHWLAAAAAICIVALFALSQQEQPAPATKPAGKPNLTPEQAMALSVKYGQPGPQHAALKALAGRFDAEFHLMMSKDGPSVVAKGSAVNDLLYDGRYLRSELSVEVMGQPYKSTLTLGFDNIREKYVATQIDTRSTMILASEGSADAAGKVITMMVERPNPMTGKVDPMKTVTTLVDPDRYTYEAFETAPGGKEFRSFWINYTREK